MGMSIDLAIKVLKRMIIKGRIAYNDRYAFESLSQTEERTCSFAMDIMNKYQQLQADYENRLKADMVAMLTDLQLDVEEQKFDVHIDKDVWNDAIRVCSDLILQRIDKLKEVKE